MDECNRTAILADGTSGADRLLPAAYAEQGVSRSALTAAFFVGCAVMASSLVLEKIVSDG